MLELKDIVKKYIVSDTATEAALKGVTLSFRKNEFVAVLGPSGCGKTTLLNIVGGLDHATGGELIIDGISTKKYRDRDWDVYRNRRIGFVFQSYNLIPHLSVRENVEIALVISGKTKAQRRETAQKVLERVGLADQMNKRPNQLSGGQMQRVSIARALVNNPEIILADEPTGALDSTTSIQVMDLLAEVAKERLVILVTHNADIAQKYANRTIKLLDGKVISDTNPYFVEEEKIASDICYAEQALIRENGEKEVFEAKLGSIDKNKSQNDIDTPNDESIDENKEVYLCNDDLDNSKQKKMKAKKPRTRMGFWTALSLSFKNLLTKKMRTFLTSFAGSIGIIGIALVLGLSGGFGNYIDKMQVDTMSSYPLSISKNGINIDSIMSMELPDIGKKFTDAQKVYLQKVKEKLESINKKNTITKQYIDEVIKPIEQNKKLCYGVSYDYDMEINAYSNALIYNSYHSRITNSTLIQLIDNDEYLLSQYDVLRGDLPKEYDEAVIVVDQYNRITDINAQMLGLNIDDDEISFDDIMNLTFRVVTNHDLYTFDGTKYSKSDMLHYIVFDRAVEEGHYGFDVKIVGILRPNRDTTTGFMSSSAVGYTYKLKQHLISLEQNEETRSEVASAQAANREINVLTGAPFGGNITFSDNAKLLGLDDTPTTINIYPVSFDAKDTIKDILDAYNQGKDEENTIIYTDMMQLFVTVLNTIVDGITYVLLALTAVSLVVSSVMIGIITYVSVLERTKEIGILRSIGARKMDISRVFNAETLIIGFVAGVLGVGIAYLLGIPINLLLLRLVDIRNIVALNPLSALMLILISMTLTLIAGLVPSRIAAKRDPVVALRTE
jgi:putative ABC transport system permease protein